MTQRPCTVVNLETVREARRMAIHREQAHRVLETNRLELTRLHDSGALFTSSGARVGRQLLLARKHLLKITALIDELSGEGPVPPPRTSEKIEQMFSELETLLDRTATLTQKTQPYLERL